MLKVRVTFGVRLLAFLAFKFTFAFAIYRHIYYYIGMSIHKVSLINQHSTSPPQWTLKVQLKNQTKCVTNTTLIIHETLGQPCHSKFIRKPYQFDQIVNIYVYVAIQNNLKRKRLEPV